MNTEIKGTVHHIDETQTFPSGFSKRILVINTGGDYPQTIPVELVKEKCSLLDNLTKGLQITAHVNIRGNEHKGKYYANIQCWKFDAGASTAPQGNEHKALGQTLPQSTEPERTQEHKDLAAKDDIPF